MKVIVVGCTHAGTAAIKQILQTDPSAEVTVYERNDNVSFLSCGIALYIGGEVKDPMGLFYSSPDELAKLGANVQMEHDVLAINNQAHTVRIRDLQTGEEITDSYDKLVMTSGSWPVIPKISGIDSPNVLLCKNWGHAQKIIQDTKGAKRVVVVGSGYIGIELVEAFQIQGKEVINIDASPCIMNKYLDHEFTDRVQTEMANMGRIRFEMNQKVTGFVDHDTFVTVKTDKGSYEADKVVLCIGFRPNTDLLKGKVDMLTNGAIRTNDYMQTSDPDIFAAGDSAAVHYNPSNSEQYLPLATNAVRQGTLVGLNIVKPTVKYMGTQSSSGLKLFGTSIASTGLTLENAQKQGIDAEQVIFEDNYRPEFMPTTTPVLMSLVWDKQTHRILGGALLSKYDIAQSVNTLSVMIQNKNTIEDLAFVDMLFQPHFDRPFHFLNILGQQAVAKAAKLDTVTE